MFNSFLDALGVHLLYVGVSLHNSLISAFALLLRQGKRRFLSRNGMEDLILVTHFWLCSETMSQVLVIKARRPSVPIPSLF